MLTKLEIKLNNKDKERLSYNMSSLFQGVLMENLTDEYINELHINQMHPYSQSVTMKNDEIIWSINTMNIKARENIIDILMKPQFDKVFLKHKDMELSVISKTLCENTYENLFSKYYIEKESSKYVEIEFQTPTAFKSNGKYINMPTSTYILKNLLKKYDAASTTTKLYTDGVFEEIEAKTDITGFNIRSVPFYLEGVKIPAFMGRVTIKIWSNDTFTSMINMLLAFGEYSGIGIKTAIGMGKIKIISKE